MFERKNLQLSAITAVCWLIIMSGWEAKAQVEDEAFFPRSRKSNPSHRMGCRGGQLETVQLLDALRYNRKRHWRSADCLSPGGVGPDHPQA